MSESKALINLGDLARPATVLIEKISDAIGGIFRPHQIRRIAEAEAEAARIRAVSQVEITELQRRAMYRFFSEEAKKQANIESITEKALPDIQADAQPQQIEDDWISHFFDNCRLISDEEMQKLWARVLAGEANSPGQFSKRTVSLLSSLDKSDAELFQTLCSFAWRFPEDFVPLVYGDQDPVYHDRGINFDSLTHLDDIGLISYEGISEMAFLKQPREIAVSYQGAKYRIEFQQEENNQIGFGHAMFSRSGKQLAHICESPPIPGLVPYVLKKWQEHGYKVEPLEA